MLPAGCRRGSQQNNDITPVKYDGPSLQNLPERAVVMNQGRFLFLLLLFGAGFLCCAVKGCRLAGPDREKILARGEKIARVWRTLPAKRGRILDSTGKVLVWSELYCDLHYSAAGENELSEDEQHALIELFGKLDFSVPPSLPLRRHLRPDEIIALEPLLLKGAPLKIAVRHERLVCNSDTVRRLAGKVVLRNTVQCGISGWELENELLLRGIPGRFSILLDRFGNYMPKSFKLISPPSNGKDLVLKETLAELEQKHGEPSL